MPNRCGCANACSCLVVAGDGISVEGIGTLENPYEITSESSDLVGRVEFTDDGNVDFTTTGVGTINDPLTVFADAVLAMSDLTDVPETEPADDGDILVWRTGGWVYEQPAVVGPTLPPGGTDGQVLTKQSSADGDADWETFSGGGGGGGEVVLEPSIIASYWRTAAMTGVVGATTILWDTPKTPAEGITYTPATGIFTVLTSGWYLITTRLRVISANSVSYQLRLIDGTGAFIDFMQDYATTSLGSASLSKQVYLAAGSTFQVHLSGSGTGVDLSVSASGANAIEVSRLDRGVVGASAPGKTVLEPTYAVMRRDDSGMSIPNAGAPTIVTFNTELYNSGGIPWVSGNQFTVPVDGWYQIDAGVTYAVHATGARVAYIYVGSAVVANAIVDAGTGRESSVTVSATVYATAGNYLTIRTYQNSGAALALNPSLASNWFSVTKVPSLAPGGGGVVVERPTATARRYSTSLSIPNSVATTIPYDYEDYNEGGWVCSGGVFTVPSDGLYQINAKAHFAANATGVRQVAIVVNGSTTYSGYLNSAASTTNTGGASISRTLKLLTGDLVMIQVLQTSGVALALALGYTGNSVDITKVPQAYAGSAVSTYGERNYSASRQQSAATSFANNTYTTVDWDLENHTDGIPFAAGIFTVPVAGYYQVNAKVCWVSNNVGSRIVRIVVNGGAGGPGVVNANAVGSINGITADITRLLKLAAGDQVSIQGQQNSGGALTLAGASYNTVDITKVPAPVINGAAASGVWGVGNLTPALVGTDDLVGRDVYIDSKGQLRTAPLPAELTGLGIWRDCKAEVRFCTDSNSNPNTGQVITDARYMKIGKTVFYKGYGVVGSAAVTNFALLLPPSAGVPYTASTQVGAPQAIISGSSDSIAGGWFITAGDRIVNTIGASTAYSDSAAGATYRWNLTYEVL